jgi:prepilin-type N-terminal cleavage/methylation domain-containing protein
VYIKKFVGVIIMVKSNNKPAFTLAEVLVAIVIGCMILIAVLTVYGRVEAGAAAIEEHLEKDRIIRQVHQLIAEDIDRIIAAGSSTTISVENKYTAGLASAQLKITKFIYDEKDRQQPFEEIIWQTNYKPDTSKLVLYRSHSGLAPEDKLLDSKKQEWQREMFIPVCEGITFFNILVHKGQRLYEKWDSDELPDGIEISLSFDEPFKSVTGAMEVLDSQKYARTIAVDRTKTLKFIIRREKEI